KTLNLKQLIVHFVNHRHDVVVRRTKYELEQAEKRAHILEGLLIALDHLDEVIALIRASKTVEEAREGLMREFELSEIQARAILDMRLQKLTGLEREKIKEEYEELQKQIAFLKEILASETTRMQIIKDELIEVSEKYGDERRSEIVPDAEEFNPEDFYADDDMVITISHLGYIKRTPLTEFRTQGRGGVGSKGSTTRDEDFLSHLFSATMHNTLLFFTEKGKCFWMKVYQLPEGTRQSKGRAIQNMMNLEPDDRIMTFLNVKNLKDEAYINNNFIVLVTRKGIIKKTSLEAYSRPRSNGINAINIKEGDILLEALLTNGKHEIVLGTRSGKAIRFKEEMVRAIGRTGSGVKGVSFSAKNDRVIGVISMENQEKSVLVVSEKGYGKRSSIEDYRITNRGGKGVKTINVTPKTGNLIGLKAVTDEDDLMIITKNGIVIRVSISNIRVMGRATQGVRLINLRNGDEIAALTQVPSQIDDDEPVEEVEQTDG
ncbi:MAG TPA: DNA gyrase C-terminal beta-propeller domain-containing protein, partial [Bacteroidales bacterium]|nr:DNA gyrase C-terminal beta-propeller domain-containing protein [Bacteroidales bacterium]